ncbi:DUF6124 family protein [Pseudomonas sp. SZMC_28357]|uniref:DUF6124 family protein n=1 Tax=Pseudomonas sp. SZMC_28357 TaxID=3074380 RepID=UPI00287169EC|nr:DUF6124 family protein [Pseudomonas sp. SZMC_28357]MDR9754790.1 DUF6124 family protein [Pseudomonas sp. SZMC_28357]
MIKPTPNPPETDDISPYSSLDPKKLHEAADRALDHYLNPRTDAAPPRQPSTLFMIAPGINNETLLVQACESLASASVMASDFADQLQGPQRNTMLALQQIIMLGELAVNRALDNIDPAEAAG